MSNLFTVTAGRLRTPSLKECGVEGVMRSVILDLARESGLPVEETVMTMHELYETDEVFVCNAIIGLWPVRLIEQHAYPIGPVTRRLAEQLGSAHHSVSRREK
jgi:4-amino-4-deoxychorismate lyase